VMILEKTVWFGGSCKLASSAAANVRLTRDQI